MRVTHFNQSEAALEVDVPARKRIAGRFLVAKTELYDLPEGIPIIARVPRAGEAGQDGKASCCRSDQAST